MWSIDNPTKQRGLFLAILHVRGKNGGLRVSMPSPLCASQRLCHLVLADPWPMLAPPHTHSNKQPCCCHPSLSLKNTGRENNIIPGAPIDRFSGTISSVCWWGERPCAINACDRTYALHFTMYLHIMTVVPCAYKDGIWLSPVIMWVYEQGWRKTCPSHVVEMPVVV